MSFTCYLFRMSKKDNSTKQPAVSNALQTIEINFNTPCSVVNPVLEIDSSLFQQKNVFLYNYCYIPHFKRYYYIDDWVWSLGLWTAACHVDVLASWRNDIFQQQLYIMRSTYDSSGRVLYDGNVADSKYPVTSAAATYQSSAVNNPLGIDDSLNINGVFVVGIINAQSQNGALSYYAMTAGTFLEFCQKLFNYSSGWLDIDVAEISEDLQKALVNPFQYVASCIYLPIDISKISQIAYTTTRTIYFGWWSVTLYTDARIVNSAMHVDFVNSLSIPRHPLAASRGNYLNLSPYSIYTLRYYPFGTIDIDSEAIASWNTLDLYTSVDVVTGKAVLNIAVNGKNNPLRTIEAQVGVQIPTASLQTNYTNIATGKTAVMAAGASMVGNLNHEETRIESNVSNKGGFLGGLQSAWQNLRNTGERMISDIKENFSPAAIKQTATDIFNMAVAASTTAEIQGMQGTGGLFSTQTLTLSGRFLPIVPEDFDHTGRPLMQTRQIASLSGFCIVKDADVSIACTDREKQTIRTYLEGGFYVE